MEIKDTFLKICKDLLKPRTVFTIGFFGTFCFLILHQVKVPPILNSVVSGLLGYYYGEKVGIAKTNGNGNK